MKRMLAIGLVIVAVIGIAALWFAIIRRAEPPPVNLTAAAIVLPDEAEALPAGPHVDLVTARCTACHSAGMVTNQPPLSHDQWQATVTKMREAYHAEVPDADVPAILAYLDGLSAARRVKAP